MPPKAKAGSHGSASADQVLPNAAKVLQLQEDLELLKSTKVFKDEFGEKAKPLSLADGGNQEPYVSSKMKTVLWTKDSLDAATYKCGGHLMWLNPLYSVNPNVAWNPSQLEVAKKNFNGLDAPSSQEHEWDIHVVADDPKWTLQKGAVETISADEPMVATINTMASLVRELAKDDPDFTTQESLSRMRNWCRTIAKVTFVFHKVKEPLLMNKFWLACNLRKKFVKDYITMKRLPSQLAQ